MRRKLIKKNYDERKEKPYTIHIDLNRKHQTTNIKPQTSNHKQQYMRKD